MAAAPGKPTVHRGQPVARLVLLHADTLRASATHATAPGSKAGARARARTGSGSGAAGADTGAQA
jgi:hypothetical protein